ncbi:hypothetical protein [Boudabousia marimammalium]|uniref:Uncharacterized protein n=1 Tax=Boudabousia marimammalium TaxID=156892 RepID=A0A1Q5PSY6_9ACTO|nr:hypothetical protein [Boudabousia marimammalium]OKL50552.1 hypothetical protein BM477_00865 [Boudabousia marimammalium]
MLFCSSRRKAVREATTTVADQAAKTTKAAKDAVASIDLVELGERAQELAEKTMDWAAPKAQQAWSETVKVAAPKIEAASEAVRPHVDAAHEKLVDDYLPRVQRAMRDAADAAQVEGSLKEKAGAVAEATSTALTKPVKKGHPVLKGFGFSLLAVVVGAAGYVLWRRSQPIEDPWAEEYWADLEAKTTKVDFATEAAEAEEAVEEAVANMELKDPKESE